MSREILVVEDDARIAELLLWFLKRRGYSTRLATTFAEVREQLLEKRPELMICDVHLGGDSAKDVLPDLASEGLLPPTLVVSGFLEEAVAEQLEQVVGVVATVRKPYELPQLEALISSQLASSSGSGSKPGA